MPPAASTSLGDSSAIGGCFAPGVKHVAFPVVRYFEEVAHYRLSPPNQIH